LKFLKIIFKAIYAYLLAVCIEADKSGDTSKNVYNR